MAYSVTLDAINEGESTEYVTAAWLEQASDGPRLVEQIYPPNPGGGDGPFELRPRATLSVEHYLSHADLGWMRDGFYGRVELGSGAEVRSEREMLSALWAGPSAGAARSPGSPRASRNGTRQ
jgi:hypothetical protein